MIKLLGLLATHSESFIAVAIVQTSDVGQRVTTVYAAEIQNWTKTTDRADPRALTVLNLSGSKNEPPAKKLGAHVYIYSKATNAADALQKLGGAQVILATAPSSKAMSDLFDGLGTNGKLMVV